MPPPKLAADAPVLNAAHPVVVHLRPPIREEPHFADRRFWRDAGTCPRDAGSTLNYTCLRLLHAWILQEPLFAQARFDGNVGAFAEADVVCVRLRLLQRASGFHDFRRLLT